MPAAQRPRCPPSLSGRAERAAAARGRASRGNNPPLRRRPIWLHPFRRPAGGSAGNGFLQRKKMVATTRSSDGSWRSGTGELLSLDTPPPARPRDYAPHDARKLTVFGRARDSALDRPESLLDEPLGAPPRPLELLRARTAAGSACGRHLEAPDDLLPPRMSRESRGLWRAGGRAREREWIA